MVYSAVNSPQKMNSLANQALAALKIICISPYTINTHRQHLGSVLTELNPLIHTYNTKPYQSEISVR